MAIRLSHLLTLVLLLLTPPLYAQDTASDEEAKTEEASERLRAQMAEIEERLQLTDEQKEEVRPILVETHNQRQAVLAKHGIDLDDMESSDRPGRRTLRKMRGDMKDVNENASKQLQEILSEDQMDVWDEMQEERRTEMRKRLRGGT